ncbi:MAG: hypothetical protein RI922_1997 [Bacteroidota bacterium]|jgi:hypothetical protein
MNYKKLNVYLGWLVFLIATVVFFITIEDTVSLWDCGEYITAAYKLEVGHPPGAPLFMVLGRLFSFFANPEDVAVWINRLSAVSSSLTVMFMFWSMTLLLKKIAHKGKEVLSTGDSIAIFGASFVGALAYTFSESFWFSAVEGEVYAMSSLFTAVIFWAILRWDDEMRHVQNGTLSNEYAPNRWLLLIMFLLGLAIGVHLLGILVVPAISFVIYFRYKQVADVKGILLTGVLSIVILGFIQEGVIPGSISLASSFEVAFVNTLGLPFYAGTIFFFATLILLCVWLIRLARKKGNAILYNATMGLIVLLIGYGSFAVIVIRSNANTPLDENDPENLVTLTSYLKREQYGSAPIFFGPQWNSKELGGRFDEGGNWIASADVSGWSSRSPFYLRRFVVTKGDVVIKAYKSEKAANEYASKNGGSVEEKYFESNAEDRINAIPAYSQAVFFPRMYWDQDEQRINGYKNWSGYDANDDAGTDIGKDGNRLPTFGENMTYFFRYQVNWMYFRYFMWNFAGRQNDIQGHGDKMRGNWISGFSAIDNIRLGNQEEAAPYFTSENPSHNTFFLLPLIFGLIGLFFHFYRAPKDAFVVLLAFLFTGLAIVVYLNQKPFEPRERDYAYAGSFYFFALWIGIGVYALYDAFVNFNKKDLVKVGIVSGAGLVLFAMFDTTSEVSAPNSIMWLIMVGIGGGAIALMMGLKKVLSSDSQGAVIATLLGLSVPVIMGMQGWDDHDRSLKTSADDLALNYLNSCAENGILFTNGDNDTFPLWYMQEVEGKRTDVRVCNLSLLQTDWYTEQMKMRAYESDPLPIKFREDQILMGAGKTDQVLFSSLFELFYMNVSEEILNNVIQLRTKNNRAQAAQAVETFNLQAAAVVSSITSEQANVTARIEELKVDLTTNTGKNINESIYNKYRASFEIISALQGGLIKMDESKAQAFQQLIMEFEKPWNSTDLKEAMAFVRDDKNLMMYNQREVRMFPSQGFILKVNKENAVKSGVITKEQKSQCLDEIRFEFDKRGIIREQVMMLDVLANNDWKRGIYFSSPGGSDVSIALYKRGYVKQNGMAFELSPLNEMNNRYADEMYDNLMKNYVYGAMNNPDVLTDYYTRRHTSQYRLHYASLADDYLMRADNEDQVRKQKLTNIQLLRQNGQGAQANQLEASLKGVDERIANYKKKAKDLINRSLQVMPADVVIDYGEPQMDGRKDYMLDGVQIPSYNDGILHDYVDLLYRAGDKKSAEALGQTVADQLESIIKYYELSHPALVFSNDNTGDLYAAMDAYFVMYQASNDPLTGNPKGALAKRTKAKIKELYTVTFPSIFNSLEELANNAGESTRRSASPGLYAGRLFELQDYLKAMGIYYGYLKGAPAPKPAAGQPMSIEQLQQLAPIADSVTE